MADYAHNPKTLDQLISQCQNWDGEVKRVVPYFGGGDPSGEGAGTRLESVGIWLDSGDGEYEVCWRWASPGHWTMCGDGAGDPSTAGGSVLTGRDLG